MRNGYFASLLMLALIVSSLPAGAQLGYDLDIKKPEPFQDRELRAEKTSEKKFRAPRRFFQNTTTHYNYFFNANNKLNEVIDRAKAAHKDDYTRLLPFYNYSLSGTAGDSLQLDSVIYKSKTGIVLHDLRNDWIDDLYLLWGAAYYLQQEYDSAYQMFQFINWAFADKEKDGYYKYIGSRMDGNQAVSIATKENNSFPKSMISDPPSRNTALLWQIRTLIQQNTMPEAGALIAMLKADPNFPKRLLPALEEVQAYWFYNQQQWDSSAHHLVKALEVTSNKQERARWEYLAAQMFEKMGDHETARQYYNKAITHTTDPMLEVYARLFMIRNNKAGGDDYINNNIQALINAAKKDKYREYRDVIYSMAAQMELERGNLGAAQVLLFKASQFKSADASTSNDAYLQLADIAFRRAQYLEAAVFYDSVKIANLPTEDAQRITERKAVLSRIVALSRLIRTQDSLQLLAGMPEAERATAVRNVLRQLRKEQGLKDDDGPVTLPSAAPGDPFGPASVKGEWYFYNPTLKTNGTSQFKQAWGTRPNVDNWRRFSDVTAQLRNNIPSNINRGSEVVKPLDGTENALTYESLMAKIPLTAAAVQLSNDSIQYALFALGSIYMNDLENYPLAIDTWNDLRRRYTPPAKEDELLFNLYYGYTRAGNAAKAAEMKQLLLSKYPTSRYATILQTGVDPASTTPTTEATKAYEDIYDMFIAGRFEEAVQAKQTADAKYKTNYWSPQLLYIEAVYHIRQRNDSAAKLALQTIMSQNGGTPMAAKAANMLDVLSRRAQIEDELSKLQIQRPVEDSLIIEPSPITPVVQKKESAINRPKDSTVAKVPVINKPVVDTSSRKPLAGKNNALFQFKGDAPHYAVMVLTNVDVVYVNEARNAFARYVREKYASLNLQPTIITLNDNTRLLLIGNFPAAIGAIEFVQAAKPSSPSIVPWLKSDKYYYTIISPENLEVVKGLKDLSSYNQFLEQNLPVKF